MKFNIFFTLKGPAGTVEAPNNNNPVEADSLASLLVILSKHLFNNMLVQTVGVRVYEASTLPSEETKSNLSTNVR